MYCKNRQYGNGPIFFLVATHGSTTKTQLWQKWHFPHWLWYKKPPQKNVFKTAEQTATDKVRLHNVIFSLFISIMQQNECDVAALHCACSNAPKYWSQNQLFLNHKVVTTPSKQLLWNYWDAVAKSAGFPETPEPVWARQSEQAPWPLALTVGGRSQLSTETTTVLAGALRYNHSAGVWPEYITALSQLLNEAFIHVFAPYILD